ASASGGRPLSVVLRGLRCPRVRSPTPPVGLAANSASPIGEIGGSLPLRAPRRSAGAARPLHGLAGVGRDAGRRLGQRPRLVGVGPGGGRRRERQLVTRPRLPAAHRLNRWVPALQLELCTRPPSP